MKHEPKKHFDVSKPHHHRPDPTSKPIIVGHHPTMPDPMIREEREKAAKPITVTSDSGEPLNTQESERSEEPAKKDDLPGLSDISAPYETSPALTPSSEPSSKPEPPAAAPTPESTPDAVSGPSDPAAVSGEVVAEPMVSQPYPTVSSPHAESSEAKEPPPSTPSEPPAGQELHIPAGHGHAAVHHKPRIWVWVIIGLIILVWVYAAVDALTGTKLPVEFFTKPVDDSSSSYGV